MRGRFGDLRSVEWTERLIVAGECLAVSGRIEWELAPEVEGYRHRSLRLVLRSGREPLVVLAQDVSHDSCP